VTLPSRKMLVFLMAMAAAFAVPAPTRADDDPQMRQELASLTSEIERLDASLAERTQKRSELQRSIDAYAAKVEQNNAVAQQIREWSRKWQTRKDQVAAEHEAIAALCRKNVPAAEYNALLAQCEKGGAAYQHHADELKQDYEKLKEVFAKHDAELKQLKDEQEDLQHKSRDIQEQQVSLHDERETAVKRFNEIRERLIAAQAKSN
jgi:chromosome segregation ATPase